MRVAAAFGRGGGGGQAGPDRGAAEDASGRPDRCERPEGLCERRRSRSPSTPWREYWWVPGWPAAPVHLCLQALGRCDLLRPPAKFRLRRILRRLPPRTIVLPQKHQIVRCSTRGAFAFFERGRRMTQVVLRLVFWHDNDEVLGVIAHPATVPPKGAGRTTAPRTRCG